MIDKGGIIVRVAVIDISFGLSQSGFKATVRPIGYGCLQF